MAFGGCGWPKADDHCFTEPSAETDIEVSFCVQDTPHTASECAIESSESEKSFEQVEQYVLSYHASEEKPDSGDESILIVPVANYQLTIGSQMKRQFV